MSDGSSPTRSGRLPSPVPIVSGTPGRPPTGSFDRRNSESSLSVRARVRATLHERRLGVRLEQALDGVAFVLHHRVVDQGAPPVDHLVIGPTGVWPIRAIHAEGKVSVDRAASTVRVGHGDTAVVFGLGAVDEPTVTAIERRLAAIGYDWAWIKPAACLTQASLRRQRRVSGVLLTTPRRLVPAILGRGQLAPPDVQTIAAVLDSRFPAADA